MGSIHLQGRLKTGDLNFPEEDQAGAFVEKKRKAFTDRQIVLNSVLAWMELDGQGWHPPQNTTSTKITKQMLSILEQMESTARWLDEAKALAETLRSVDWSNVHYTNGNPVEQSVVEQLTALDHSAKHMLGDAIFFDED